MTRSVTVIIGGGPLGAAAVEAVDPGAPIVAADSGLDAAVAAGLRPTALVGDLDSITAAGRMWALAHELPISQFPVDKDATDTELAIDHALALDAERLVLVGGSGNRVDHVLGALVALGRPPLAHLLGIDFVLGDDIGHVVHPGRHVALHLPTGTTFSLLALHGPCAGIEVVGARWPLHAATLAPGETRGISNQVGGVTQVSTLTGVLTVIVPGALR